MASVGNITVKVDVEFDQFERLLIAMERLEFPMRYVVGMSLDEACEVMHDAYEKAAVGAGWETNTASRKPWADVPEANKATMRAAVTALFQHLDGA